MRNIAQALDSTGWVTTTVRVAPTLTCGVVDVEVVRDDGRWIAMKLRDSCRHLFEPFPFPWRDINWPYVSFKVLAQSAPERPRQFDTYYGPCEFYPQDVVARLLQDLTAYIADV